MIRNNKLHWSLMLVVLVGVLSACAAPAPQIVEVEKPVIVEKEVPVTIEVEKVVEVEKIVEVTPIPGKGVTLNVWLPPFVPDTKEQTEALLEPFEKATNIQVDVTVIGWADLQTMWVTAIQARETPDISYNYDSRIPDYFRIGALEPLDAYVDEEFMSRYLDEARRSAYHEGQLLALPAYVSSDVLFYNKEMFAQAGIEDPNDPMYSPTWEEFLEWNIKLTEAGFAGYDYGIRAIWDHPIDDFFMRFGCTATNADYTEITFDTPQCLKAAQAWYDLAQTYDALCEKCLTMDWSRGVAFQEGEAAMVPQRVALAYQIQRDHPELEGKWGIMRPFHDEMHKAYLGIGYFPVFEASKHKQEAATLLRYMSSDKFLVEWSRAMGGFPAVKAGAETYADAPPEIKQITDLTWYQLTSGDAKWFYPFVGFTRWATEVFVPNFHSLMLGETTPEDFTTTVTEEGNKILAEEQQ